ncbi:DUF6544 family protein [Oceanispirochaeta crateris]|nr:DUF6544 family protein [Oceanispirochaeta crateris]
MFPIIMIILISMSLIPFAGKIHMQYMEERERKLLRSLSADISHKIYREEQIIGLPAPVQRYFRNVLTDGQPYISTTYLKHDGRFKTALDKEWINIEGEQYFTCEDPGFLWNGKTSLYAVQDMYIAGRGQIKVFLFNIFKVVDGNGPEYDQGELLRWLGESVWFPTNLLPSSRLQWTEIDEDRAKLSFTYKNQKLSYKVSFNATGEITELETQRFMGEEKIETWIGRVGSYQEINHMKIPMRIEAFWKLPDGEHSYAQFTVREVHYQ